MEKSVTFPEHCTKYQKENLPAFIETQSLKGKGAQNNQCPDLLSFQTLDSKNELALNASNYTNLNKLTKTLFYFPTIAYKP